MALDPSIWGSTYWKTFHFIPYAYEDNPSVSVQTAMKNFILTIPLLLPCKSCQGHAYSFISATDVDAAVLNKKSLAIFFFNFHNEVNKRLNKPQMAALPQPQHLPQGTALETVDSRLEIYDILLLAATLLTVVAVTTIFCKVARESINK
jgi:hypothetical protein